jgi:nucleoside phosphorylase
MKILIFCALKEEALPIAEILNLKKSEQNARVYEGQFSSHSIILVISGMGRKNTLRACDEYLNPIPDLVFSCGYSGGLDPNLPIGSVVLSREILILKQINPIQEDSRCDLKSSLENFRKYFDQLSFKLHSGSTVTSFHVVSKPDEKEKLARDSKALSVDMEAGFIAKRLPDTIPFFNVRAISDTVDDELEIDFSPWITKEGNIRKFAVMGYLLRHPDKIKFFWKIFCASQKARKRLVPAVQEMIKVLPLS